MTQRHQSRVDQPDSRLSRRFFVKSALVAGAIGTAGASQTYVARPAMAQDSRSVFSARATAALKLRQRAAAQQLRYTAGLDVQQSNGDDDRYAGENYYASFTKALPHDQYGEADATAYQALLLATETGSNADYAAIPLDPSSVRTLANPQGALRFILAGLDGHATRIPPAPAFRSAATAAEMGELYWLALTRDVSFVDYESDALIADACKDLNAFSETVGPTNASGQVDATTVFRGGTPGDLVGPYLSQFLWKDVPYGPSLIEQRYLAPLPGSDFMTDEADWLNIQTGGAPFENLDFESTLRYIHSNRSLGEYVHRDVLFQAYFNAAMIAFGYGPDAIDIGNPYLDIANQGSFTSLGGPWMIDLVTQAANLALLGAWYQKWNVHRRCRPEVYGGRLQNHILGRRTYELHDDILNCEAVNRVHSVFGTYHLPMAFTEGSPTHPAYPAGHACVSGACATILKAVFNEQFIIPDPVVADATGAQLNAYSGPPLTLGNEFNKLANNISLGRDAAGVHYRTDGSQGLVVGEQQAIGLLRDYSITLNEEFGGFHFTKFDGTPVTVINGRAIQG